MQHQFNVLLRSNPWNYFFHVVAPFSSLSFAQPIGVDAFIVVGVETGPFAGVVPFANFIASGYLDVQRT